MAESDSIPALASKRCSKCEQHKPLFEFHKWKYGKDGHKGVCKPCNVQAAVEFARRNPEATAARQAQWTAENRDKRRANYRNWYRSNIDAARKSCAERGTKYRATEKYAAAKAAAAAQITAIKAKYKVKRKAAEEAATPPWADELQTRLVYIYAAALGMQVDHIVPIVSDRVCGLHWHGNMQLLPKRDNIIKGNRRWPDMP